MDRIQNRQKTLKLTETAILTAVIILFAFTPFGYLKMPGIEITFIVIPVAVGAIVAGPAAGAFLGFVFGVTSFIQCFTGSVFGALLWSINPVYTVFLCIVPRTIMGWLAGLIFSALSKATKNKYVSCVIASLSAALLNTILFIIPYIALFSRAPQIKEHMAALGANNIFTYAVMFVGLNGLVEAVACMIIGFAISSVVVRVVSDKQKKNK